MERVFAVHCADYSHAEQAVERLIALMGGIEKFIKPQERVCLKPNLLSPAAPDDAVTVHPSVVGAVGRLVSTRTRSCVLAESPGAGYLHDEQSLKMLYEQCGMIRAAERGGFELSYDTTHEVVMHPDGKLIKRFEILTPVRQADALISICKLKTHTLTMATGAVKNLFGIVPGRTKTGYHGTLTTPAAFCGMLLDLLDVARPRLTIMDAVIAMEGDGPQNGRQRHVGLLLGSTSPLALDVVAGEIMGLPIGMNPLLVEAHRRGLSPVSMAEIGLVGISTREVRIEGFQLPRTLRTGGRSFLFTLAAPLMRSAFTMTPRVVTSKCVSCGVCVKACPRQVITLSGSGGRARIHPARCIRCYCCHEMCPQGAIELKAGILHRLTASRRP